ncbi:hypothetical protein NIES25_56350 (plasmid) [Nostoc linckia NIES-25]|nr:hypothetical protein NIES25_56350 [Nostoc linckia NIES-25]
MLPVIEGCVTVPQITLVFYLIFVTLHSKMTKLVRIGSNSYDLFRH